MSFGEHRSRVVAEALISIGGRSRVLALPARATALASAVQSRGIDPSAPYLDGEFRVGKAPVSSTWQ
jgi:hypothetical protein